VHSSEKVSPNCLFFIEKIRIKLLNFIIIYKKIYLSFECMTFHIKNIFFFAIRSKIGSPYHRYLIVVFIFFFF
jgi:hypothetical protein